MTEPHEQTGDKQPGTAPPPGDAELGAELRNEVPPPAPTYWQTIDQRLEAAVNEMAEEATASATSTTKLTANESAPPGTLDITAAGTASSLDELDGPSRRSRRQARTRLVSAAVAASLVLLAGVAAFALVRDTADQRTVVIAADGSVLNDFLIPGPEQNVDHWHAVYGVWDCTLDDGAGGWLEPFTSWRDDVGIHSHEDGLIHIHPFFGISAGHNATFGHFLESMEVFLSDEALELDDGRVLREGEHTCSGEPATLHLRRWVLDQQLLADPAATPRVVTSNFAAQRFYNDREVWVLAFAPIDADLPPPPSDRFTSLENSTGALPWSLPDPLLPGVDLFDD